MKKLIAIVLIGVAIYFGYKQWQKRQTAMKTNPSDSNKDDSNVVDPDQLVDDSDVIINEPITFNPALSGRPELSKTEKEKKFHPNTLALESELIKQTGVTLSDVFYKYGKGLMAYVPKTGKYEGKIVFQPANNWINCQKFEPVLQPEGFYVEQCVKW